MRASMSMSLPARRNGGCILGLSLAGTARCAACTASSGARGLEILAFRVFHSARWTRAGPPQRSGPTFQGQGSEASAKNAAIAKNSFCSVLLAPFAVNSARDNHSIYEL